MLSDKLLKAFCLATNQTLSQNIITHADVVYCACLAIPVLKMNLIFLLLAI